MFNLNFISNPGMQSESSNESWSYVIEKNSLKPDEKSVLDIAKILIKLIHNTDNYEKWIEFVKDRLSLNQNFWRIN